MADLGHALAQHFLQNGRAKPVEADYIRALIKAAADRPQATADDLVNQNEVRRQVAPYSSPSFPRRTWAKFKRFAAGDPGVAALLDKFNVPRVQQQQQQQEVADPEAVRARWQQTFGTQAPRRGFAFDLPGQQQQPQVTNASGAPVARPAAGRPWAPTRPAARPAPQPTTPRPSPQPRPASVQRPAQAPPAGQAAPIAPSLPGRAGQATQVPSLPPASTPQTTALDRFRRERDAFARQRDAVARGAPPPQPQPPRPAPRGAPDGTAILRATGPAWRQGVQAGHVRPDDDGTGRNVARPHRRPGPSA